VLSRSAGEQPKYAWRDARYKLIYGTRYGQQELYDLASDPGEQREIGAAQPLLAALYRQQLQARIQSLRRGAAAAPEATALSPEQRDNLKALGYIQ
jgi:arylsulfatase A-like enzyme